MDANATPIIHRSLRFHSDLSRQHGQKARLCVWISYLLIIISVLFDFLPLFEKVILIFIFLLSALPIWATVDLNNINIEYMTCYLRFNLLLTALVVAFTLEYITPIIRKPNPKLLYDRLATLTLLGLNCLVISITYHHCWKIVQEFHNKNQNAILPTNLQVNLARTAPGTAQRSLGPIPRIFSGGLRQTAWATNREYLGTKHKLRVRQDNEVV